jgi:hypothetical protein
MDSQKWIVEGPQTIELDGAVRRLKVSLVGGHLDVIGHDEPTVRIEVHSLSGKGLRVEVEGDQLVVDHPQLAWDNWLEVFASFRGTARADVSLLVPRDLEVRIGVVSAQALVSGLNAEGSVSTVSGGVIVEGVSGDLQLNSVAGELTAHDHYGRITAHTVSGDVTVAGELFGFTGDTVSGSVFLDVDGSPDEIRVNTVSGAVTARLAAEIATRYRINTVGGRVHLDDTEVRPGPFSGPYTGGYGELAGRFLDFVASTVSGPVSVLHTVRA